MLKFLLNAETKWYNKLRNVLITWIIVMAWLYLITKGYNWLFATEDGRSYLNMGQFFFEPQYNHPILINVFYYLIIPPIFEEFLFRKYPLDIVKSYKKYDLLIPTIIFTSIIFGLMHGDATKILLQGVGGFFLACLYVKNGFSWWSSALVHFLWNGSLFALTYLNS